MSNFTLEEIREAYEDVRGNHRMMKGMGLKHAARLEKVKAAALWRWINAKEDAEKKREIKK